MASTSLTTRIDPDLKAELEQIARFDKRSTSFVANQAIRNLVEERRATRDLVETGLALVELRAASVSADEFHSWLFDDEDHPFPQGRASS